MNSLTIYGTKTQKYSYIWNKLNQFIEKYQLDIQLSEVNNISQILEENITSIPTVKINNGYNISWDSHNHIDSFVNECTQIIGYYLNNLPINRVSLVMELNEESLQIINTLKAQLQNNNVFLDLLYFLPPEMEKDTHYSHHAMKKLKLYIANTYNDSKNNDFLPLKAILLTGSLTNNLNLLSKQYNRIYIGNNYLNKHLPSTSKEAINQWILKHSDLIQVI